MKMMLIIDKPDSCETCPLRSYSNLALQCTPLRKTKEEDDMCPLRPMPEKYLERDITIETERDVEMCTHGITIGRNVLIDEIMGETE